MTGYTIQQKWSPKRRKLLKSWEIRNTDTHRLVKTCRSYSGCSKFLRKKK
jgi:hypothetical protein